MAADYQAMARQAAAEYDVSPELFMGLVQQESRWNPRARSGVGAYGLTQVMPDTARDPGMGVRGLSQAEMDDPMSQLRFGARYLKALLNRYDGDTDRALAAYNWGIGNVDKKGADYKILPEETRNYLKKVKGYADDFGGNYTVKPTTENTGTSAIGLWDGYDREGGEGREMDRMSSEPGSTLGPDGQRQQGNLGDFGDLAVGGLKGFAMGGPMGALGGVAAAAFGNFMDRKREEEEAATPQTDAATQTQQAGLGTPGADGFGLTDAARAGLSGFAKAGPLGAALSIGVGLVSDWADRRKNPEQTQVGLGYSATNQMAAANPSTAAQAGLGYSPSVEASPAFDPSFNYGYSRSTNSGIDVAGDDALSDALGGALGGFSGSSSRGTSFSA